MKMALRLVGVLLLTSLVLLVLSIPVVILAVFRYGMNPFTVLGVALYGVCLSALLRRNKITRLIQMVNGRFD